MIARARRAIVKISFLNCSLRWQPTTQLNTQTQARLSLSEKLDSTQNSLKTSEAELFGYRTKVNELETRLSKDQRTLLNAENQYRDQLTERNTLLLTLYQYMDKILGVDKTHVGVIFFLSQCTLLIEPFFFLSFSQKKGNQAETKPFTNFGVFRHNLITWLKALSQMQLDFDKRVREAETKFSEKLAYMRRQLDTRWKQIDKFESSVKAYGEAKATWRRKFTA